MQAGGVAGVATTGDDNLADASLRDIKPPQKTLSQVRHTMHRAAVDKEQAKGKVVCSLQRQAEGLVALHLDSFHYLAASCGQTSGFSCRA